MYDLSIISTREVLAWDSLHTAAGRSFAVRDTPDSRTVLITDRLYNEGLITFGCVSGGVEMTTSTRLHELRFEGQVGELRFESGTRLILPNDARAWPDADALAWHRAHVFRP